MASYILNRNYRLRGFKELPFGIMHPNRTDTDFFDKEQYSVILDCDGNTDIDLSLITDKQKEVLETLLKLGFIRECEKGEKLQPEQEYVLYPSTNKSRVQWSITGRCNMRCRHCFLSAPDYTGDDAPLIDCIRVLDQLQECGISAVGITGGEPLVHKDLYRIVEEISKRGMILESIYTNCLLVNDELLDKLESLHQRPAFNISFDGVGCHDWLRGIDGMEQITIDAIKLLKKRDYFVGAAMSLHRNNVSSIRETVKLLGELGCDHLKASGMIYTGNWLNEKDCYITDAELYDCLLEYIPQYFEDGMPVSMQIGLLLEYDKLSGTARIPAVHGTGDESTANKPACGVVKRSLYIGADGKVLPCMSFAGNPIDIDFDSVYDKPLYEIINDSHYATLANATCAQCVEHNKECMECKYKWLCRAGCRAGACDNNKTDYYGIDENACAFFKGGYFEKVQKIIEETEGKLLE